MSCGSGFLFVISDTIFQIRHQNDKTRKHTKTHQHRKNKQQPNRKNKNTKQTNNSDTLFRRFLDYGGRFFW